jgi:hypothetical protein
MSLFQPLFEIRSVYRRDVFGDFELDSCMAALLFFGVVLFCLCFPES